MRTLSNTQFEPGQITLLLVLSQKLLEHESHYAAFDQLGPTSLGAQQ